MEKNSFFMTVTPIHELKSPMKNMYPPYSSWRAHVSGVRKNRGDRKLLMADVATILDTL